MTTVNPEALYVLAATSQLDSAAGEDGLIAFQLIRSDSFDSSIDLGFYTSETGNYYAYHDTANVGGNSGGKVRLHFVGNASDTADAIAQLSFTLPAIYSELEFEYDLFIPSNYSHVVPSDSVNNNKFFRLWQTTYNSLVTANKIGASLFANSGNSDLTTEAQHFGDGSGIGVGWGDHAFSNFIGAADKGAWMRVKVHALAPTVGGNYSQGGTTVGDGFIRIYKNDVLTAYNDRIASIGAGAQGWKYGYIMGAANSGFRVDTDLYIDNLVIRGKL